MMKPVLLIKCAIAGVSVMCFGQQAPAQQTETDMCVLEHLNVAHLTGRVVVAAPKKDDERPVPGALVELRIIGEQELTARPTADADGHFELPNIPAGSYSLAAKPLHDQRRALFVTAVEVRLRRPKPGQQTREIVLALGSEFYGCHGGYAQLRKRKS